MRNNRCFSSRSAGLTLVELLVALAVAAILSVAILAALGFGARQDTVQGQIMQMNDQARAALTLLTRDLQSAGFLMSSTGSGCTLSLSYDANLTPSYQQTRPVTAASQAAGAALPLQTTPPAWPPAGQSGYTAQSILLQAAPAASTYFSQVSSPVYVVQFGTTQSAQGSGAISSTNLPVSALQLNTTQGISAGDTVSVQVPMAGGLVCVRAPVCDVNTTAGGSTAYIDSKGCAAGRQFMPPNGYQDYAGQIPASYGALTNSNLLHAKLVDLKQQPNTLQFVQWWISGQSPYTTPTLTRSVYSALTDQLISSQAIAPGVQSLQILFGTVPAGQTPGQTALTWKTWGNVQPTDTVVSVSVALVMRTLQDDPSYTAPAQIVIPQPASGLSAPDAFVAVPTTGLSHRHFAVFTQQIALRNTLWDH
jgi:type IV pilus assembly protein PilW